MKPGSHVLQEPVRFGLDPNDRDRHAIELYGATL
jgi:hypothetical protein